MPPETEDLSVIRDANSVYAASLLSSNSEALELAKRAKQFAGNGNPMLDAAFLLASLSSPRGGIPS